MNTLFALLLFAGPPDSAAVFEVTNAHGVTDSLVRLINEEVVTHLAKSKTFSKVVGSGDLVALLNLEQQKIALGCDQTSCLAELGGALGVAYLVVPSVGKIGDRYLVNLKLVDVEAVSPLWRDRREVEHDNDLVGAVQQLSQALHIFRHPKALKNTWAPSLVTAAGVLTAGLGMGHFWFAKRRYEDLRSRANYEAAQTALEIDNSLVVGGLLTGLAGSIWWFVQ